MKGSNQKKMVQKKVYLILIAFTLLLIGFIMQVVIAEKTNTAEQIRPAPQTESRGVGEQIRPANQQNLPSNGNGGYTPTQGSDYSSSIGNKNVILKSDIKPVVNTSNASGAASFILNDDKKTLSYNINYSRLSSNETGSDISINEENNTRVLFEFPLGNIKKGILSYVNSIENLLTSGNAYLRIKSLLFSNGELISKINAV